jgi:RNA:NAD 2'-phosphotransferase (TPT1/KptA family)
MVHLLSNKLSQGLRQACKAAKASRLIHQRAFRFKLRHFYARFHFKRRKTGWAQVPVIYHIIQKANTNAKGQQKPRIDEQGEQ